MHVVFGGVHIDLCNLTQREPKGDGGKGTAKKNLTTIYDQRHDNLRHVTRSCDIL